jgi:hypothetical protein
MAHSLGKQSTVVVDVVMFCVVNFYFSAFLIVQTASKDQYLVLADCSYELKGKESRTER